MKTVMAATNGMEFVLWLHMATMVITNAAIMKIAAQKAALQNLRS